MVPFGGWVSRDDVDGNGYPAGMKYESLYKRGRDTQDLAGGWNGCIWPRRQIALFPNPENKILKFQFGR